jgi:hypothetical protein
MHEDLKERLEQIKTDYDGKVFWGIVDQVKRDKINDEEILKHIAHINQKRFRETSSFTLSVPLGNLFESLILIAALVMAFQIDSDMVLYLSALVLMTAVHPLSHFITGTLLGIRFTHYYLNGPARIEPTLKIDYLSYLKARPTHRALMHASGVLGTVAAPLISALIAFIKGAEGAAFNLFILFLFLIVFELLTSTKSGDLMRARREYGYLNHKKKPLYDKT